VDWKRPITGTLTLGGAGRGTYIGKNVARIDLPGKVTGAAFIHDFELPGMLHGRVLRPPSRARGSNRSISHAPNVFPA
jgi:CO/xanthine dehydrogenase Mo-binding subunit